MTGREIKNELGDLLDLIDLQIEEVKREADIQECAPEQLKNMDGTYTMIPLLLAKAQALTALNTMRPSIVNHHTLTPR